MSNLAQKEIAAHTNARFLNPEKQFKTDKPIKQASRIATKKITYCACLVAASLICKMLGQVLQFGVFKITLVYVPWILSAIILGPVGGATVGLCTDLLGTFILPTGGAPLPLMLVSNTLFPLIIGVIYRYFPLSNKFARLYIGCALSIILCTLGLGTYALFVIQRGTPIPYLAFLITRLPQAVIVVLNVVIATILLPILQKARGIQMYQKIR